jgi:hypothetical protein
LEKVRCFRIRRLLGFLPKIQGQKTAAPNLNYGYALKERGNARLFPSGFGWKRIGFKLEASAKAKRAYKAYP